MIRFAIRKEGVQFLTYFLTNHSLLKMQLTLLVTSLVAASMPIYSIQATCCLITAGSALSYPPPTGFISLDCNSGMAALPWNVAAFGPNQASYSMTTTWLFLSTTKGPPLRVNDAAAATAGTIGNSRSVHVATIGRRRGTGFIMQTLL